MQKNKHLSTHTEMQGTLITTTIVNHHFIAATTTNTIIPTISIPTTTSISTTTTITTTTITNSSPPLPSGGWRVSHIGVEVDVFPIGWSPGDRVHGAAEQLQSVNLHLHSLKIALRLSPLVFDVQPFCFEYGAACDGIVVVRRVVGVAPGERRPRTRYIRVHSRKPKHGLEGEYLRDLPWLEIGLVRHRWDIFAFCSNGGSLLLMMMRAFAPSAVTAKIAAL